VPLSFGGFSDTLRVALMLELLDKNVTQGLKTIENSVERLKQSSSGLSTPFEKVERALTTLGTWSRNIAMVGGAITGALAVPTYQAMKFEELMAKVATTLDMTLEEVKQRYQQSILELSETLGIPATQIVEVMYEALGAGVPAEQIIQYMNDVARASIALQTDLRTASDGILRTLQAYNLGIKDTMRVADLLFRAAIAGNMSFEELAQGVGDVAGTAAEAGIPLEDMLAAVAALTLAGERAPEALSRLRMLILGLIRPSNEAKELFDQLGISFDIATLKQQGLVKTLKMFEEAVSAYAADEGERLELLDALASRQGAYDTILKLTGAHYNDYLNALRDIKNSEGDVNVAFEKMASARAFGFRQLTEGLRNLMYTVGESLLPVLQSLLETVRGIFEPVRKFIQEHPELVEKILQIVAKIGLLTSTVGTAGWFVSRLGNLVAGVTTAFGPWGWAILGVVTAISVLVAYRDRIKEFFDTINNYLAEHLPVFREYVENVKAARGEWEAILKEKGVPKPLTGPLANLFAGYQAKIETAKSIFEKVREFLQTHSLADIWQSVKARLEEFSEWVAQTKVGESYRAMFQQLAEVVTSVKESIVGGFETLKEKVMGYLEGLSGWVSEKLQGLRQIIRDAFGTLGDLVNLEGFNEKLRAFLDALTSLKDAVFQLLSDISNFLSAILEKIKGAFETITEPFKRLKERTSGAWEFIKGLFGGGQQPQQPQQPQQQQLQGQQFEQQLKELQKLDFLTGKAPTITINLGVDVTATLTSTEEVGIREFGRRIAEITADEIEKATRRAYGVT